MGLMDDGQAKPARPGEKWEVRRLGELAKMASGGTPPTSVAAYYGGDVPWVSISDMTESGKITTATERNLSHLGLENSAAHLLPAGTVLYAMYASLGECSIAGRPVSTSQAILGIQPRPSLDHEFLYYWLSRFKGTVEVLGQQGTQANLNKGIVQGLRVELPPLPEQRAIAAVLADVDKLIGSLEALIAKKRAIAQAAMHELLTGRTRLPGFRDEWKKRRLGNVASFLKGRGLAKSAISLDGRRRCIHYGELFTTYQERITEVIHGTDREEEFLYSKDNDVLMPTSDVTPNGLATASCILASDVIIGGDILVIRAPETVLDGVFLAYTIKWRRDAVMQLVTGTTVFHLYGREMAHLSVPVPRVEEQRAIADVLSGMDDEVNALERQLAKTRAMKQGMMHELLAGRVRLPLPPPGQAEGGEARDA